MRSQYTPIYHRKSPVPSRELYTILLAHTHNSACHPTMCPCTPRRTHILHTNYPQPPYDTPHGSYWTRRWIFFLTLRYYTTAAMTAALFADLNSTMPAATTATLIVNTLFSTTRCSLAPTSTFPSRAYIVFSTPWGWGDQPHMISPHSGGFPCTSEFFLLASPKSDDTNEISIHTDLPPQITGSI